VKPIKILKAFFLVKISALLILLFLITFVLLFLFFFPEEKVISIINQNAENVLQRSIEIDSISYSLRGVKLTGFKIIDPETETPLFTAKSVQITFALAPLFRRQLQLQDLYVEELNFSLDYSNGRYNIENLIEDIKLGSTKSGGNFTSRLPDIHLKECTIEVANTSDFLAPLKGTYIIDGSIFLENGSKPVFDSFIITLPVQRGKIETDLTANLEGDSFKLTGKANLDDVNLSWVYLFGAPNPPQLPYRVTSGTIENLVITSEYTEGDIGKLRCTLNTGDLLQVKDGHCRVYHSPKVLVLDQNNGQIGNSGSFFVQNLTVGITEGYSSFNITAEDTALEKISVMIPPIEDMPLHGKLNGKLQYDGKLFNGTVKISNGGYGKTLQGVNGSFNITNNRFRHENINVLIMDQPAVISAASTSSSFDNFAINVVTDKFIIDTESETGLNLPFLKNTNINGVIEAKEIVVNDIILNNTSIGYSLGNSIIIIQRFKTNFFNGLLTGRAQINQATNGIKTELDINFSNIQLQNLHSWADQIKNRFFGIASGRVNLVVMNSNSKASVKEGNLVIRINNGKLINTGIQDSFGIILKPLRYKLKDLEFKEMFANIEIDNNGYSFNTFMFNSPDIRASVNGMINHNNVANLNITLLFNTNFIQDVPNFAYPQFSKYKKGSWYIIPLKINNKDITENTEVTISE